MNLSPHFTLEEMTSSQAAVRKNIDNNPSQQDVENLILLCNEVLEPIRSYVGGPIRISSGYRSPELNKLIGGSKTSSHCFGEAADVIVSGRNSEIYNFIKDNLIFDQLIWEFGDSHEPSWVHVSYKKQGNRNQKLLAFKKNGKTVYTAI